MNKPTEDEICKLITRMMIELPKAKKQSIGIASKITGVNLYKYKNNGTIPLINSVVKCCMK